MTAFDCPLTFLLLCRTAMSVCLQRPQVFVSGFLLVPASVSAHSELIFLLLSALQKASQTEESLPRIPLHILSCCKTKIAFSEISE